MNDHKIKPVSCPRDALLHPNMIVTPAKAGIHLDVGMDPRLRGGDNILVYTEQTTTHRRPGKPEAFRDDEI